MDEHTLAFIIQRTPLLRNVKVVARNEFLHQPGLYIVNNEPRGKVGEHWIALKVDHRGIRELFDSVGRPPSHYNFNNLITHSTKCVQSRKNNLCGAYCIYYLKKSLYGMSLNAIIDTFSPNVYDNDSMVVKYL